MRLEQLRHLIEINKHRSISGAAKVLLISQPQLSNSVRNLEEELGYKIFRRNNDGLVPTSQGREVVALAQEIINYVGEIKATSASCSDLTGSLNVALGPDIFNTFASLLIIGFHQGYPNVNLIITEDPALEIIAKVTKRTSTLGIMGLPYGDAGIMLKYLFDSRNLAYEELFKYNYVLVMGAGHPLAVKDSVGLSDLKELVFVDYHKICEEFLRLVGFSLKKNHLLTVDNREVFKHILALNYGVSVCPDLFAFNEIYCEQGLLNLRPVEDITEKLAATVYLIYSKDEPLPFLAKQLIKVVKKEMQDLQGICF
ncbi:MAG: LysR family transcriptional regulator [Peptococcaceae bacterium]